MRTVISFFSFMGLLVPASLLGSESIMTGVIPDTTIGAVTATPQADFLHQGY